MTNEEFSNEFDVLVNSYFRFKNFDKKEELDSIEFNEYEKSVFLTKAQEELIVDLYKGREIINNSFEETEELRRYIDSLIKTVKLSPTDLTIEKINSNSDFFILEEDTLFLIYESVILMDTENSALVVPVSHDDYYKINNNPFKGPNRNRVLRLDVGENVVELISKYKINYYLVRYISKPSPIIIGYLPEEVTINNKHQITPCELNDALHRTILDKAVALALNSRGLNINK
jgi:hypothetical protein